MIVAIATVAGIAYWDEEREGQAALENFAEEQASLADALAGALRDQLAGIEREAREAARASPKSGAVLRHDLRVVMDPLDLPRGAASMFQFDVVEGDGPRAYATVPLASLLSSVAMFERTGEIHVLIKPPARRDVVAPNGAIVNADVLVAAFASAPRSIHLSRADAATLGLPARTAVAGFARTNGDALGIWNIAVVATAQSERDRATRAMWRLLLGVALAGSLVVVFGGAALRTRTKELELRHALAIQELETERDENLVRADKLATLGALATGIAHEISTPLGVIVARAEQIVSKAGEDARIRRSGELIVAETVRIDEVIRGFLTLARGGTPRLEDADPAVLARNAMGLVRHRFSKASVRLDAHVDVAAPPVSCDPTLLEQVLVNLLLNACDACDDGGAVEVSIEAGGARVAFVVTDNGAGIQDDDVARVMEPFFTTKPEGTGLGLAIATEIVKHHRGSLVLRSRTGARGTRAVVDLPASTAPPAGQSAV